MSVQGLGSWILDLGSWILDPGMDTTCLRWYVVPMFVPSHASQVLNPSSEAHGRLWRKRISLRIPKNFQDPKSTVRKPTRASLLTKPSGSEIVLSASLQRDEKEARIQHPRSRNGVCQANQNRKSPRILDRKSEAAPLSRRSEYHHPKSRVHALLVHVKGEQKSKIQDPRSDTSRSPCTRTS